DQQIKISAEYLLQRLYYSFDVGGHTSAWVMQGALGADYLLAVAGDYIQSLELDVYYSYAPNKRLSGFDGSSTHNFITTQFINNRGIAGSNAWGISPGVNFNLWTGAIAGFDL